MHFWFCLVKGFAVERCNGGLSCVQSFPQYSWDVDICGFVYLRPNLCDENYFSPHTWKETIFC